MYSQDSDWSLMFVFPFGKEVTVFGFFRFLLSHLFACFVADRLTQRVEQLA